MNTEQHKPCPDWISLIVVSFLGAIALVLVVGILRLTDTGAKIDAALFALAGSAVTGLASLLSNPHRQQSNRATDTPQAVEVVNPTSDPVNVTETADEPEPKEND